MRDATVPARNPLDHMLSHAVSYDECNKRVTICADGNIVLVDGVLPTGCIRRVQDMRGWSVI